MNRMLKLLWRRDRPLDVRVLVHRIIGDIEGLTDDVIVDPRPLRLGARLARDGVHQVELDAVLEPLAGHLVMLSFGYDDDDVTGGLRACDAVGGWTRRVFAVVRATRTCGAN